MFAYMGVSHVDIKHMPNIQTLGYIVIDYINTIYIYTYKHTLYTHIILHINIR